MDAISPSDLVGLFAAWRATFAEQRDFLISLDGKVGDSDLGITMAKAFAAAAAAVGTAPVGASIGKIIVTAGAAIAKAAPSTTGTLTATGFLRGGKALAGAGAKGVREAAAFWRAYGNGIAERGKAKVGVKTILDVIDPLATAIEAAARAGDPLGTALSGAARAAEAALEPTKTMLAQHGKAAAFQQKSVGHQDAGATVGVLMIQTMRDFAAARPSATPLRADETALSNEAKAPSLPGSTDPSAIVGRLVLRRASGISFQRQVAAVRCLLRRALSPVQPTWAQVLSSSGVR
jgi:phosphoenolpyruvate---glycerone phosphotransferase subunit DhaL